AATAREADETAESARGRALRDREVSESARVRRIDRQALPERASRLGAAPCLQLDAAEVVPDAGVVRHDARGFEEARARVLESSRAREQGGELEADVGIGR